MFGRMPYEFRREIEAELKRTNVRLDKATLAWAIALGKEYGAYYFSDAPMNHFVTMLEREWFRCHAPKPHKTSKTRSGPRSSECG